MANNINLAITDPFGLQTPAQQVQAFFVAQISRDLEQFKECVVYYSFDYDTEAAKLEQQFTLWLARLNKTEHVLLQGINALVPLTQELKQAIVNEAKQTKAHYIECCKYPQLAQYIDNAVKIKLESEPQD